MGDSDDDMDMDSRGGRRDKFRSERRGDGSPPPRDGRDRGGGRRWDNRMIRKFPCDNMMKIHFIRTAYKGIFCFFWEN